MDVNFTEVKKMMMKYLMISCKEATFLTAKKEEGKLSFREKLKLMFHLSMCTYCKRFEKQASEICKESIHITAEEPLPDLAKEKIKKMLEEHF